MEHEYVRAESVRDVFRVDLRFEELGLELASGVRVLNGVNGEIRHGRLTVRVYVSANSLITFIVLLCFTATSTPQSQTGRNGPVG